MCVCVCQCVCAKLLLYPPNILNKLENYLAGSMRFAEELNKLYVFNFHFKYYMNSAKTNQTVTPLSHVFSPSPLRSLASITVTGVCCFCCHPPRLLTIRKQLCIVQWNVPFKAIQWNRIPFDQCLNTWQQHIARARLQIMCVYVCVCVLSIRSEKKKRRGYDAFVDFPLPLIQLSIYFCLKHAFQIIFTVGFASILMCCCFFFSNTFTFCKKFILSSFFCWDECCLICMCLVIIVTFCHISRLIFLSRSFSLFELIRKLGPLDLATLVWHSAKQKRQWL